MIVQNILLICVASLPYIFSLEGDFVFDDTEAILRNKDVTSDSWIDSFYNDFWGSNIQSNLSHKSYRPLTVWTFRINYLIANKQLNATQFKAVNLLCHVVCCVLVHKVYQTLVEEFMKSIKYKPLDIGFYAALLFAVHPVHVEAVSGIVGRADVLAAITFFAAFLTYVKAVRSSTNSFLYLTFTIILAIISMLCKENGITVLGFCITYDLIKNIKINRSSNEIVPIHKRLSRQVTIRIIVTSVATVCILYGRWRVMGGVGPQFQPTDNPAAFSDSLFTKWATRGHVYALNALLLLWPAWLCYDWSMGCVPLLRDWRDPRLASLAALLAALAVFVRHLLRGTKDRAMGLVLAAAALAALPFLPAAGVLRVGFVLAERVLYLPSAGHCLLVALGAHKLLVRVPGDYFRKGCVAALCVTGVALGARAARRAADWRAEAALFAAGPLVCPLNAKLHYNAARALDAAGRPAAAERAYREAIRLYPEYYQAMNNLANLLKNRNLYSEAETYLRKAISLKEEFPAAWMNLGIVLAHTGRSGGRGGARAAYARALRLRPVYPDCLYNLGNLHLQLGQAEAALRCWRRAAALAPAHAPAWTNALTLLDNTGQQARALALAARALRAAPGAARVHFAAANILGKAGRLRPAERHFLAALRLLGDAARPIHFANLGVLYHRWKKLELAEDMYRRALRLDPTYKSAINNLHSLKLLKNT